MAETEGTSRPRGIPVVRDGKPVSQRELIENVRVAALDCIAGEVVKAEPLTRALLAGYLVGHLSARHADMSFGLRAVESAQVLMHDDFDAVRDHLDYIVWTDAGPILANIATLVYRHTLPGEEPG